MVWYLAARLGPVSKHVRGHRGQKLRAKARRRGTWGKAMRRRALARASAVRASKTPTPTLLLAPAEVLQLERALDD